MKKQVNKKRKILIEMILMATIASIMVIFEFIIMMRLIDLDPLNNWSSSCIHLLLFWTTILYCTLVRYQYRAYKKYEKEENEEKERLRQSNEAQK